MSIFKSLFGNKKTEPKVQTASNTMHSQKDLNESMQCLGLDFLLMQQNLQNIKDAKEVCFTEEYACVSATINNRPSAIVMCSMMYPAEFFKYGEDSDTILEIANKYFDCTNTDIYAVGFGLINKNAPSEKEKSIYRIGTKYSVCVGNFHLISTANDAVYGTSIDTPIPLNMVSTEYFYLEHLKPKYGELVDVKRVGSFSAPNNPHMLDKWQLSVGFRDAFSSIFKYTLYMDAYALKPYELIEKPPKKLPVFFEWVENEND